MCSLLFFFKEKHLTRVLQKVLSLGSDYFSATFYQITFLPSREKQINSLLLVSVGDTDK